MRRLEQLQPTAPAPTPTGPAIDIGNPERTRALYDQWRRQVGEDATSDVLQWLRQWLNAATAIFGGDTAGGNGPVRLSPRSNLALAQAPASPPTWRSALWPAAAPAAWTLLTAPTDEALSTSTAILTAPQIWLRLAGGTAIYDAATGAVAAFPPRAVVDVATQPFSLANVRLASANWFSINIAVYVWVVAVMALCVGVTSWMFLRRLGRKDEP